MRIRINVPVLLYWLAVFVLELVIVLYVGGFFKPAPQGLKMTETQAMLTRGAITLVVADIERGTVQTTEAAITALGAELPSAVKDDVLAVLGTPNFDEINTSLAELSDKIEVEK